MPQTRISPTTLCVITFTLPSILFSSLSSHPAHAYAVSSISEGKKVFLRLHSLNLSFQFNNETFYCDCKATNNSRLRNVSFRLSIPNAGFG